MPVAVTRADVWRFPTGPPVDLNRPSALNRGSAAKPSGHNRFTVALSGFRWTSPGLLIHEDSLRLRGLPWSAPPQPGLASSPGIEVSRLSRAHPQRHRPITPARPASAPNDPC